MASTSAADVAGSASMTDGPSTSREEEEEKVVDEQAQFEILHSIERFLQGGNFGRAAAALRREINEKKLVPLRTDFNGANHERNYQQFLSALSDLPSRSQLTHETLPTMISRLSTLSDGAVKPPVKGLKLRLIVNKRSAIQRTNEVLIPPRRPNLIHANRGQLAITKNKFSPIELLRAREMGSRVPIALLPGEQSLTAYERHYRIACHLSPCFCVCFDRTENFLITGADDNLIKVFNVNLALLKFTYRGHAAEIADIAVSQCNQLVASASVDKTLRVWRLRNGETLAVLRNHTAGITTVRFLPFAENGNIRYLVTTGYDCVINFYAFNEETLEFPPGACLVYSRNERDQPGAKMLSICYSEGGHIVVTGESHGIIRVYRLHESGMIEKTDDIVAHTDRIDSLMWAHKGIKFASGSKDGVAKIFRYEYGEWTQTTFALSQEELVMICGINAFQNNPNSKNRYTISMICWTLDDAKLITTASDFAFRVWDATSGGQLHKLSFHTNDIFHILPHPIHANIIFSAAHDGQVALWDVVSGERVKSFQNTTDREQYAILDVAMNRDGTRIAAVDTKGYIYVFGQGTHKRKFIKQQFLFTDYHPLVLDEHGYGIDEKTGVAPHLMNPQLCGMDCVPYPPEVQAMVPDRDYEPGDEAGLRTCPWLKVDIVPRLDEDECRHWAARQSALSAAECDAYTREMLRVRSPSPSALAPVPIVPFQKKARATRPPVNFRAAMAAENAIAQAMRSSNNMNRLAQAQAMAALRRDMSMRYLGVNPEEQDGPPRGPVPTISIGWASSARDRWTGIVRANDDDDDVENDVLDSDEEESSESTNTSDTDYESGDGERRRARERERQETHVYHPQGTASRPRRRERTVEVMDVDDEMDETSQQSRSSRTGRSRRRRVEDDFGEDLSIDMNDIMLPSSSTRGTRRQTTRRARLASEDDDEMEGAERPERSERRERGGARSRRVRRASDREEAGSQEPEDAAVREERAVRRQPNQRDAWKLTFPDWMREVKRKRFPYVAQLGDHVVYFRQGHEHYMNQVEEKKLYRIDPKMVPSADIANEEFAIVDDVKYLLKPYRLTQLKLAKTDEEGRRTGVTWNVKCHDMDNVPDFIILRAFYEEGLEMGLEAGDEIEAAIDDQWWTGTVENTAKNESYANAHWLSVGVRWETGDDDTLSIWDLRRLTVARPGPGQQPVTEDEVIMLGTVPTIDGDWPEGDEQGEATRGRMKRILETLAECEPVKEFKEPVPVDAFPDYPMVVAYPMDLQTICERIDNQYYRRFRALLQDVRYVALSAEAYNERGAVIVRNAKVLVEAVIRLANDQSMEDFVAFYDSCHDLPDPECVEYKRRPRPEVNSDMLELLREADSARANGDAAGGSGAPGWIRDAAEILEDLMQQPCARHFTTRDEQNEELAMVWEACDDLRTLCDRVRGCEMSTPNEVEAAVHSLVSTVKNTIDNRRSEVYKNAVELHTLFNGRFRGILAKFESAHASVQQKFGVPIARSLRRRKRDEIKPAYNTRRSDHSASLTAANLAAAAAEYDDQPSTSSRSAARHERGFYRTMVNGGPRASQETEVSSTSSRGRRTPTGKRSARSAMAGRGTEMEDEPMEQSSSTQRRRAVERPRRSVPRREVEQEEEEEEEEEGEAEQDEALAGYEAPTDEEVETNAVKEEEEEEEESQPSDESEEDYEEEEEEYSTSRSKKGRAASKRRKASTEDDEAASTSTASSLAASRTRRVIKRRRILSDDQEEEEEDEPRRGNRSRGGGGRAVQSTSRPTRQARQNLTTYDERSDEDELPQRAIASVSQRGRLRTVRQHAD